MNEKELKAKAQSQTLTRYSQNSSNSKKNYIIQTIRLSFLILPHFHLLLCQRMLFITSTRQRQLDYFVLGESKSGKQQREIGKKDRIFRIRRPRRNNCDWSMRRVENWQ